MSFNMDVKNELCKNNTQSNCCIKAELYGICLFSHHFGHNGIILNTENIVVAERLIEFCRNLIGIELQIYKRKIHNQDEHFTYVVKSNNFTHIIRMMEYFGHDKNEVSLRINRANMEDECCVGAFLRGVFLSCGLIMNPEKGYHLEFNICHQNISKDLMFLMQELELFPKFVLRRGGFIVYYKESENVEDILSLMGATKAAFGIMDVKVIKSVRNKVNRLTNCETANIGKTVAASSEQIKAIRILKKRGMLRSLTNELREVSRLRIKNPELSLRELGELMSPKLSRSGVSHRLKKLIELSQNK
jgi:DNA-binding protein WhiA